MNYVWEAVLQIEKKDRDREKLTFIPASNPSPYIEVSMIDLNLNYPEEDRIEINALYRLSDIFGKLLNENEENMRQVRELFFDICMHYIVQLDLREGLACEDYFCSMVSSDFMNEKYGLNRKKHFNYFNKNEKKMLLRSYLQLLRSGNYVEEFRRIIVKIYPLAIIYENDEMPFELLVYLGVAETDSEKERTQFLRDLFLPLQGTVYYFYEHHFGIIDVEATMILDEIILF